MNKQQWKKYYRLIRIGRREAKKVSMDMMIYGSGYMVVVDGEPKRVSPEDIYLTFEEENNK